MSNRQSCIETTVQVTRRTAMATIGASLLLSATTFGVQAQSGLERVTSEGKVTVGIHNRWPWGYRDENGEVAGFSPDLVRAAFVPLGVTEIDFVVSEFGALIPGLASKRFDAIASGLYITPVRCESVAFSDPDMAVKDAALVTKGNPLNIHSYADIAANPDIRYGGSRGSANAKNAAQAGVSEAQTSLFQDTESTLAALIGGRVDVISFSAATVAGIMADDNVSGVERAEPFTSVILPSGMEKSGYTAIAFHLDDTDLRDAYNERLAAMKADGTVASIMERYGFTKAETAPDLTQEDICAGSL